MKDKEKGNKPAPKKEDIKPAPKGEPEVPLTGESLDSEIDARARVLLAEIRGLVSTVKGLNIEAEKIQQHCTALSERAFEAYRQIQGLKGGQGYTQ